MFRVLDIHEPLLINSIGHSMGLLLFAGFLILVLRDRRVHRSGQGYLPVVAATLALLWNAGSLTVLASSSGLIASSDFAADFSGLVAGAVGSLADALRLTGAEQSAIGLSCGDSRPTIDSALTSAQCSASNYGAARIVIPQEGMADDDHNPARITARHLFDVGAGTDNLFRKERYRTTLRFTATNLSNKAALYNFLSTFSGTHFVAPRVYQVGIGLVF